MGDKITIKKIQLVSFGIFRIDLFNETQNKSIVTFCPKEKLYELFDEAEQEGRCGMSKAILVMDMPIQCCDKCKMCYETETDEYICVATDRQIPDGEKPNWCPLREVPQKTDFRKAKTETVMNWIEGYNACIDEIMKGSE